MSVPLTPDEIAKRIDAAWHEVLEENGLAFDKSDFMEALKQIDLSPETAIAKGLTIGAAIGLTSAGKQIAHQIKDEKQLDDVLQDMRTNGTKIPSLLRRAVKEMTQTLPRRGGPGRKPKLSPKEARIMCDQISLFIRQKNSLKKSLQLTSNLAPSLLNGKKVGARTLQNAWKERDLYL